MESFHTSEHFATFHLRAKDHVQIVFHQGAKAREANERLPVADPEGMLQWRSNDRAVVCFYSMDEIVARGSALQGSGSRVDRACIVLPSGRLRKEMTLSRQSDIEVYLRDCAPERLISWLEAVVGPLGDPEDSGKGKVYRSAVGPVIVTPGIEGGHFVSVCFNTALTPWETDIDCARQAAKELGCMARCCPGDQFPEEAPLWVSDAFLEISGDAEKLIRWEHGRR